MIRRVATDEIGTHLLEQNSEDMGLVKITLQSYSYMKCPMNSAKKGIKGYIVLVAIGIIILDLWYTGQANVLLRTLNNLRPFFSPNILCHNCTHFSVKYLIHNDTDCDPQVHQLFLLNIIVSLHSHVEARNAIRRTWGSVKQYKNYNIKTIFAFGRHSNESMEQLLQHEADLYHDILQANFREDYLNLTWKSIVALTWATNYCKQAKFILKTDDDSFNHPYRIIDYLEDVKENVFIGGYCLTPQPIREPTNKYMVDVNTYPYDYYPTYCGGPGYILSQAAARAILTVYNNVKYLPMEDTYISGLVRMAAGIPFTQIPGMIMFKHEMNKCGLGTWLKTKHNVGPKEMELYWERALAADVDVHCINEWILTASFAFVGFLLWSGVLFHIISTPDQWISQNRNTKKLLL